MSDTKYKAGDRVLLRPGSYQDTDPKGPHNRGTIEGVTISVTYHLKMEDGTYGIAHDSEIIRKLSKP